MSSWYKLENKATPTLWLYDEIGGFGVSAHDFIQDLTNVTGESIDVHISSLGGEVFQGFAIYQALKDHPALVNIYVDSVAASIASVIAMAGDKVVMGKNSQMMIHDGHVTMQGNASDLTRMVDQLNRASDNIASVYAERTGGDISDWRNAMKKETWFNADEAVAAGLADEVSKSTKKMRNVADLQIFNYAGRQFAPAPTILGQAKTSDTTSNTTSDKLDTTNTSGIQVSDTINTESLIKAIKEGLSHG